ncbi:MAG: DUF2254 domain-containing protein [Chloroflexota bacterium]
MNTSLWFRPAMWVLVLAALAFALMLVDRRAGDSWQPLAGSSLAWFFVSGADGARAMLGAVATAVLTVSTLAYSIMMVAVVQTANSYSPRLLRQYLKDTANQHVLGILIGTFIYSLLVLRAIHAPDPAGGPEDAFVPALATNGGLLLALLSTGAFIYFINHAAHSISVGNIVLLILHRTEGLIESDRLLPKQVGAPADGQSGRAPEGPGAPLRAKEGGYLQYFDTEVLMRRATAEDLVIRHERTVGDYVLPGMRLITVWPADALDDERLQEDLASAVALGKERSLVQDVLYGVSQLSDVAVRALSPGVNDPSTAIQCVDALSLLAGKFIAQLPISPYRYDDEGHLRLIAPGPALDAFLDTAFTQIRRYGSGDLRITLRLLEVYKRLGHMNLETDERRVLWQHAVRLMETAAEDLDVASDRLVVNEAFRDTAGILQQEPDRYLLSPDRALAEA